MKRKLIALGVMTASLLQSVRLMSNSVRKLDLWEYKELGVDIVVRGD